MSAYATVDDMTLLWRTMTSDEQARAEALLPVVSATLRMEAKKRGRDLDLMIMKDDDLAQIAKEVTVSIAARVLQTSTTAEPTTQFSQSAMGYSVSGSYLVPGGGMYIKKQELARLGLNRQRYGSIDLMPSEDDDE